MADTVKGAVAMMDRTRNVHSNRESHKLKRQGVSDAMIEAQSIQCRFKKRTGGYFSGKVRKDYTVTLKS
jgi:hypothetical protein